MPNFYSRKLSYPFFSYNRSGITMHFPPNELYSAFSFIGFVLCAIPFYWHLKGKVCNYSPDWSVLSENDNVARNTGTCLFMIWTGLGCLLQCINSIVWNKNTINRAPVYCDICNSLDAFLLNVYSLFVTYSNPCSSRAQCCNTGFLTLHQSPAL